MAFPYEALALNLLLGGRTCHQEYAIHKLSLFGGDHHLLLNQRLYFLLYQMLVWKGLGHCVGWEDLEQGMGVLQVISLYYLQYPRM